MHCDWFILPLLLPTPTISFSLVHKWKRRRRSRKRSRKKWKCSDPSDFDTVALMTPLTTPTPSSVAGENKPLASTCRDTPFLNAAVTCPRELSIKGGFALPDRMWLAEGYFTEFFPPIRANSRTNHDSVTRFFPALCTGCIWLVHSI